MNISFREVEISDAKMLLDWRTDPKIAQWGIADVPYNLDAQKKWILDCYASKDYYHWVIVCDNTPIGCISVQNFDRENSRTAWGFYKGATGFQGVGQKIPGFLYNWLFLKLGIRNIYTDVLYNNIHVIELYLYYGFRFMPEQDRVVLKNGREALVIALSLTRENWDAEKYRDSIADFPTKHWKYAPV